MGIGVGSGLLPTFAFPNGFPSISEAVYHKSILSRISNEADEIAIRLVCTNHENRKRSTKISIQVEGTGTITRQKGYFLEPSDGNVSQSQQTNISLHPSDYDIVVFWVKSPNSNTSCTISYNRDKFTFTVGDLLNNSELTFGKEKALTANILSYQETGKLDSTAFGIADQDKFRFSILADLQGGDPSIPKNERTRMKIHNAFIEDTVALTNNLSPEPSFSIILGDFVDSIGQEENFVYMERLVSPLKMPLFLEIGNHETPYNADFSPSEKKDYLKNYFDSQKRINGSNKLLYSFDVGKWHFVVWPDPLRKNFWMNYPHYFDWLENDLEKHKEKPVVFFQHVPIHPIGIDPLTSYVESVSVRKQLLELLTKFGNVKYVFSGHVHIPLKASLKTAVTYKGIKMINLPAAGYRPRAFGEPDFFGGPEQGVCVVDIDQEDIKVHYQHVTKEWFTYPDSFPAFDDKKHALWFNQPWELPSEEKIRNHDFSNGLQHWHQRFVYHEDKDPSNICEIRETSEGKKQLYLLSRKRGYDVPGQDRLPQHINRVAQRVSLGNSPNPALNIRYRPESGKFDVNSYNGFFLILECYSEDYNCVNLVYSTGKIFYGVTKGFGMYENVKTHHFDLPAEPGKLHDLTLPFAKDYQSINEKKESFSELKVDSILVWLGVWTVNEGIDQQVGMYIDEVSLTKTAKSTPTTPRKPEGGIWYPKMGHIAGEHHYIEQEMIYPPGLNGK